MHSRMCCVLAVRTLPRRELAVVNFTAITPPLLDSLRCGEAAVKNGVCVSHMGGHVCYYVVKTHSGSDTFLFAAQR